MILTKLFITCTFFNTMPRPGGGLCPAAGQFFFGLFRSLVEGLQSTFSHIIITIK